MSIQNELKKYTTLFSACSLGDLEVLQELVADRKILLDEVDANGLTCLTYAARNGHLNILQYLLESKLVSIEKASFGGMRPLHHACNKNQENIVKYLLNYIGSTIDVNAQCENGDSPLHYACARGVLNIMILLLDAKADPKVQNNQGITPLHRAASFGQIACVRKLCELDIGKSLLDIVDNQGDSALHFASKLGFASIVKLLLEFGSDQTKQNKSGSTAKQVALNNNIAQLFS